MMRTHFGILPLLTLLGLVGWSCASLEVSRPIMPVKEYEKLLVGSLEADFVGNEECLKACHKHDQVAAFLEESVHGQQKVKGTAMPLVNCETCHGPGSQAIEGIEARGVCDTTKLIALLRLPPGAQSLVCLKCHSSYSMASMQFWPASRHALAEVSCLDCHLLHKGTRQKLSGEEINAVCEGCHPEVKALFAFSSRHPVPEGKMTCVSCHDPHGSNSSHAVAALDERELCLRCHAEKSGPYLYEHGGLGDNCSRCHEPHGTAFGSMLARPEPFLCLECHAGHANPDDPAVMTAGLKRAFYTRCTNCHTQIHGTDSKGPHPSSGFIQ